jgi:hypothetical protein
MKNKDLREAARLMAAGDWKAAHEIVQEDEDSRLSCWAHGIVHLMEGDAANARYWYRKAGRVLRGDVSIAAEVEAFSAALGS